MLRNPFMKLSILKFFEQLHSLGDIDVSLRRFCIFMDEGDKIFDRLRVHIWIYSMPEVGYPPVNNNTLVIINTCKDQELFLIYFW